MKTKLTRIKKNRNNAHELFCRHYDCKFDLHLMFDDVIFYSKFSLCAYDDIHIFFEANLKNVKKVVISLSRCKCAAFSSIFFTMSIFSIVKPSLFSTSTMSNCNFQPKFDALCKYVKKNFNRTINHQNYIGKKIQYGNRYFFNCQHVHGRLTGLIVECPAIIIIIIVVVVIDNNVSRAGYKKESPPRRHNCRLPSWRFTLTRQIRT